MYCSFYRSYQEEFGPFNEIISYKEYQFVKVLNNVMYLEVLSCHKLGEFP